MADKDFSSIEEFKNSSVDEQNAFFDSLPAAEQEEFLDMVAEFETAPEPENSIDPDDSLLGPSQGGVVAGEIKPGSPTRQSYPIVSDILRAGAGAAGAAELGALGFGFGGVPGAIAGGLIGAAGGSAASEGLMQGFDSAELAIRGQEDPMQAFDEERIGAAAVTGAIEAPMDMAGALVFKGIGKLLKGRASVMSSAKDDLAKAIVGDAESVYRYVKNNGVQPKSTFDSVRKLIDTEWEPIFNAREPDELFKAAIDATGIPPSRFPTVGVDATEADRISAWGNAVETLTPDIVAAEARELGSSSNSIPVRIAKLIDDADQTFKDSGLQYDLQGKFLPSIANFKRTETGKVDVDAILNSGENTWFARTFKPENPDRRALASELAQRLDQLDKVAGKKGLTPRTIQDFKVELDRSVDRAHLSDKRGSAKTELQKALSNHYREELKKVVGEVDAVAGSNFGERLAVERERFQDLKDAIPAFDKFQAQDKAGKLVKRKVQDRGIPGGQLGGAALFGQAGRAVSSSLGLPDLGFLGATIGADIATKKLPSRLQRVVKSTATLRPESSKTAKVLQYVFTGNIPRVTEAIMGDSENLENAKDAIAVSLMREQGLVDRDGALLGEIPPEFEPQLEAQIDAAIAPITEAIRSGDELDIARGIALVAKQFPDAFPKAQLKGEVSLGGKRFLPLEEDRLSYSRKLKDDIGLSPSQKALMRSAVHNNGEIIERPEFKSTAPINAQKQTGLESDA